MQRVYLDNAATSFPKPPGVLEAMNRYATALGASAGRGAYREAMETGALMTECRRRLNRLFHAEAAEHFIFTLNCSDALNLAIYGLLGSKGGHAVCTEIDHNSILRPFNALADDRVITQTRVKIDPASGLVDPDAVRRAIRPDTRLIAVTHASNVTGTVQPIRELGKIARERGIPLLLDAAQSAGHVPIDVQADCVDLLAAPGHKGLLGPLGTGFLYIRPGLEKTLKPLRVGGTGSVSDSDRQPEFMPDRFEPGSHNAIGIIGLSEGVNWVLAEGVDKLARHQSELCSAFIERVSEIDGLTYFGPRGVKHRVAVFSVRIEGLEPQELAAVLESSFGILTRAGIHCAPAAHAALGTSPTGGTTRLSFGPFVTVKDVHYAASALAEIAAGMKTESEGERQERVQQTTS